MSFSNIEGDIRERFAETLTLYNHLRSIAPPDLKPVDDLQKAMRGLWLVSLYAAVERSVNVVVDASIQVVTSHAVSSKSTVPSLHSIFHYSKIQALKDCGRSKLFDSAVVLLETSFSNSPLTVKNNPLSESLQNVDAGTMIWIGKLFGTQEIDVPRDRVTRLSNLRERRNAVAHGRESASSVGERFNLPEMLRLYNAADTTVTEFLAIMRSHCETKQYLRIPA